MNKSKSSRNTTKTSNKIPITYDLLSYKQTFKVLVVLLSVVLRWSVSLYSYSGSSLL